MTNEEILVPKELADHIQAIIDAKREGKIEAYEEVLRFVREDELLYNRMFLPTNPKTNAAVKVIVDKVCALRDSLLETVPSN